MHRRKRRKGKGGEDRGLHALKNERQKKTQNEAQTDEH